MSNELYKKYRPTLFKNVIGQDGVVKQLKDWTARKAVPHAVLFSGPSGCGKTTLARILASKVDCQKSDLLEINCASERGIGMVREVQQRGSLAPMWGTARVWIVDECHQLTGEAQGALLKTIEDTHAHAYYFLATTHPEKLRREIRTRVSELKVRLLTDQECLMLLESVCKKEKIKITEDVASRITSTANGSARKALVILHQISGLKTEKEQLKAILDADHEKQSIDLAKMLLNGSSKNWSAVAKLVKEVLQNQEAEEIRRQLLGYCASVMLNANGKFLSRAFLICDSFRDNYFDSGRAGLILSCYEVLHSK